MYGTIHTAIESIAAPRVWRCSPLPARKWTSAGLICSSCSPPAPPLRCILNAQAIYPTVLSSSRIAAHFAAATSPPPPPPQPPPPLPPLPSSCQLGVLYQSAVRVAPLKSSPRSSKCPGVLRQPSMVPANHPWIVSGNANKGNCTNSTYLRPPRRPSRRHRFWPTRPGAFGAWRSRRARRCMTCVLLLHSI